MDKKIFFAGGDGDGCFHYRTKLPAQFLGQEFSIGYPIEDERRDNADIIILQRASNEYFLTEIPRLQALGKKVIYDIDDNLWCIPSTNNAFRVYNSKLLKQTKEIIKLCNAVIVSTKPLQEYFIKNRFNEKVYIIPNFLEDVFPKKEKTSDIITVGYCGTSTHRGDFDHRLVDTLRNLKGKVRLVFVGYNPVPGFEDEFITWVKTEDYMQTVYDLNIDIALGPLANNEFNRCKSNLKWLESGAMGSLFVCSDVYPYHDSVGSILIENDKEWKPTLEYLISDKDNFNMLKSISRDYIKDNFTYKYNGDLILDLYKEVLSNL